MLADSFISLLSNVNLVAVAVAIAIVDHVESSYKGIFLPLLDLLALLPLLSLFIFDKFLLFFFFEDDDFIKLLFSSLQVDLAGANR